MPGHTIGTREEWEAARAELAKLEAEQAERNQEIKKKRRELPWVPVEKEYEFDTADGKKTLAELFDGRSQLLIYHFQHGPSYTAGCPINSSIADSINGILPHLHARDVTLLLVSRAPLTKLHAYKQRMGWSLPWASSANSDFNFDFGSSFTDDQVRGFIGSLGDKILPIVRQNATATGTDPVGYLSEAPGMSAFTLEDGAVYQTYATTARGLEFVMTYYPILDRMPKGRDEGDTPQTWIRRHDEYA
jgi:predicted dithiol-disulfide oxidoreductase (DUF899 family)